MFFLCANYNTNKFVFFKLAQKTNQLIYKELKMISRTVFIKIQDQDEHYEGETSDVEFGFNFVEDNEIINERFNSFFDVSERSYSKQNWFR